MSKESLFDAMLAEACGSTPTEIVEAHNPLRRYTTYYCTCIEKMSDELTYKTIKEVEISAKVIGSSRKTLIPESDVPIKEQKKQ